MTEWSNWSGSLRFTPGKYVAAASEAEVINTVHWAANTSQKVRVVGKGHSSSPLVETNDVLISLDGFNDLISYDKENNTAIIGASMTVGDVNEALQRVGLTLFNAGDVDVQRLSGAIATGTHGSGKELQNLASILVGANLVKASGEVVRYNEMQHPEILRALRVSLGSLGIITTLTIKVKPIFRLQRLELFTSIDECMTHFDQLANENRNADFYWYPRNDLAKIRFLNEPDRGSVSFPFRYTIANEETGDAGSIISKKRELKFEEMEYAMDEASGMACFREIRERVKKIHRRDVAWRILYRLIAADDYYISPHYGRRSVAISLHHNAGMPYDNYFNDIEPIFKAHGGRPHWAKKHSLTAKDLKPLYPEWDTFQVIRNRFDPSGLFMNNHLSKILKEDE